MNTKIIILLLAILILGCLVYVLSSNKKPVQKTHITDAPQNNSEIAPYGSWESPLIAASIFEASDSVSDLSVHGDQLYFIEQRAAANGRNILVRLNSNNDVEQLTSSDLSVQSRVHEYGGRAYLVNGDHIYYSNFSDQKIYSTSPDSEPQPITTEGLRYMQCAQDSLHNRLICVREDHRKSGEPVNTLVAINLTTGSDEILFSGTDFVSSPQVSPDGTSIAFITWSHPNMPWDDTQLRILTLGETLDSSPINGDSGNSTIEVPQGGNVAFSSPSYAQSGTLYFLADFSNWRTLYRLNESGNPEIVLDQEIEIVSYDFEAADHSDESNNSAIISYLKNGLTYLARANLVSGELTNIDDSFASAGSIVAASSHVYFIGSTSNSLSKVYSLSGNTYTEVYKPKGPEIPAAYLSTAKAITFPTGNNEEAYGFFYAPQNIDFKGAEKSRPPLIVKVHGGPVSATYATLDPSIQFWTSRGFAVFDVNHRGSTGYGRAFRKKLYPNWGIIDIEDAANGVRWLAEQNLINPEKVAIRGGSAGGYTTLAALAFQNVFKAGVSYFGISDLEILAQDTHKFESRFLDQLIGPYPEMRDIYLERSPIHSVDKIKAPLLLLQGLDDKVVPPNQSEMIFEALKKNCIATAYLTFEGEGHGFRQPANNIKALNSELDFYGQIFDFTPAGNIESIKLEQCDT